MKSLILYLSFFLCVSGFAQTVNKGTWQVQAFVGQGIYNQNASYSLNSGIGAAPAQFGLSGEYLIQDRLSIGLNLRANVYAIDEAQDTTRVNVITASGGTGLLVTKVYLIDKEKFNFYGGIGIGASFINLDVNGPNGIQNAYAEMDGFTQNLCFGFNWYFAKNFGLTMNLGYINHNLKFDYLSIDGQDVDRISEIEKDVSTLNHRGLDGQIGFTFKF